MLGTNLNLGMQSFNFMTSLVASHVTIYLASIVELAYIYASQAYDPYA